MKMVCLDLEGVLIPEVWHHVADRTGVPELNLTTRDVKDYRELMEKRVEICARHDITLEKIQKHISELPLLEGAREFTDGLRARHQLIILSDTFYEFAGHFMHLLGWPTLFCHNISYDTDKQRLAFHLRQENSKKTAVAALRSLNFRVIASGDSYNDIHMLREAHRAAFFRAPAGIREEFPEYPAFEEYSELQEFIDREDG